MKKCYRCDEIKDEVEFHKNRSKKDGLTTECKKCTSEINKGRKSDREYNRAYYKANKAIIKKRASDYANNNKEKRSEYLKEYAKKNKDILYQKRQVWRDKNKENQRVYFREYKKKRLKHDELYAFKISIRKRVHVAFKNSSWKKNSTNEVMLGCDYSTAKKHIESQFKEGMTWGNHTRNGWHIDHRIPLGSAKTEDELIRLCNYKNLQPLWAKENLSKGSR